jgi:hypothetical protein
MGILRATVLCGLAFAMTAAPAHAGTVASGLSLGYTAAPGEANRLSVTRAADRIVFGEAGGIVIHEAAASCDGDGTPTLSCAAAPAEVVVALGDGDDTLTLAGLGSLRAEADGGDGADRLDAARATGFVGLSGGVGDDTLLAGAGESDLAGGPGADAMTGGPESAATHYLMGAAPDGPDRVAGGEGLDVAGYSLRSAPLLLAPDGVPNDGEAGEGDDLGAAVERLEGGAGADQPIAAPGV